MGGCIAQWLGIAHPDKVRSLILAATWGRADGMLKRALESWANLLEKAGTEGLFEQAFLWCYTRDFFEPRNATALAALDTLVRGNRPPPDAFRRQSRAGQAHDAIERLSAIKAPTLVMVGEEDILTPRAFSEELAARIPGATLDVLPRLGHAFYEQSPEAFNDRAEAFWRRHR
jgi:pimeloyl-ACP methyl ester carboxylesterase